MLFTRAKAEALLNRTEMGLYDDSRINNLRRLAASEIGQRIERGRRARDRARDLVRRQKLSSRERTGAKRGASGLANERSKQKAELMADILKRFEAALAPAKKRERELSGRSAVVARKQAASRTAAKTGTTRAVTTKAAKAKTAKTTAKRVAARRDGKLATARNATADVKAKPKKAAAATSAPATSNAASVAPAKAAAPTKRAAAKASDSASKAPRTVAATDKPRRALTPKRALAKTRKLLEAKQASDREAKPWQTLDPDRLHVPEPGYQSSAAARNAVALHAAESRMAPIHGSISTRDRRNQGKRDHRGDND
ncbi:hypothetical protein ACYX7E_09720 [Luteimonas sp. RIT-PG2_3]